MRIDWSFLSGFNGTSFKSWSSGWLWIWTGLIWGVVAVIATLVAQAHPPTEWLFAWLGGLAAYSGIGYAQFKTMRDSDYGALERKAEIEKAKAGLGPAPTSGERSGATGEHPVTAKGTV